MAAFWTVCIHDRQGLMLFINHFNVFLPLQLLLFYGDLTAIFILIAAAAGKNPLVSILLRKEDRAAFWAKHRGHVWMQNWKLPKRQAMSTAQIFKYPKYGTLIKAFPMICPSEISDS